MNGLILKSIEKKFIITIGLNISALATIGIAIDDKSSIAPNLQIVEISSRRLERVALK